MSYNPSGQANGYYNQPPPQQQGYYQQQPPQQPYGQQQPPYGQPPPQQQAYATDGHEKMTFDQTFKVEKPKWNDLWAGILFLLVCAGFVVVSAFSLQGYSATKRFNGGGIYDGAQAVGLNTNTIVLFLFVLCVALVFSYAYVWCARLFPKQFIWITGILNIVFGLVTAIYMLARHYYSAASCSSSSALMLKTSVDVSKSYGHVYLVSFLGGLLATALAAWYSITFVAVYAKYQPGQNPACREGVGGCSSAKVTGLLVFVTFAMYWISEWLKNTIHTSISGVYGSWYFHPHSPPSGATRGALKRSLTYSFGSISLGSLVVAIINFLRQVCSMAQRQEAADGNILGSIMFCVLGCFIGLLDWAVQFLNRYAFSYIALYGKAYIPAAKDTWKYVSNASRVPHESSKHANLSAYHSMIKQRGIDALVNECLIGPVLSMGATFVAYACALMAYLYMVFTHPAYNADGTYTPVVVAIAFLIGLQICNIFTTPISSGIDTIFVAAAWQPEVLYREHPELYQAMVQVYPQVQQAIHP
ncbi:Protein pns1 [Apiospora phragmitis]|uniref:Protein PNS1 n=1 Tax=Apiospora phragmitis TaxID=2905665 RepID=A0ABR1W024_9PEZI